MPASKQTYEGWFHCGRCGGLFRARLESSGFRRCGICGKDPVPAGIDADMMPHVQAGPLAGADRSPVRGPVIGRRNKHRKSSHFATMMGIWMLLLACILLAGAYFRKGSGDLPAGVARVGKGAAEALAEKNVLKDQMPGVHQSLVAHLISATNEGRAQFVWNPVRVAPRIERFFESNPIVQIDPPGMRLVSAHVLGLPEGQAIEAIWTSQGRLYDTVFLRENGEWRLDWEHFVRFSDYPLSLFLTGEGPDECEFRL